MHVVVPVPEHRRARAAGHHPSPQSVVQVLAFALRVVLRVAGAPVDAEFGDEERFSIDALGTRVLLDQTAEVGDAAAVAVVMGHREIHVAKLPHLLVAVGGAHQVPVGVVLLEKGGHLLDPLGRRWYSFQNSQANTCGL